MRNEIKIGITFLLSLISLFIAIFFIKDIQFEEDGKYYVVQFSFLNDLIEGAHIKLFGGIRVGTVVNLSHDKKQANVKIIIYDNTINELMETQRPNFSIKSSGLLGEKYLLIGFKSNDRYNNNYISKIEIEGEKLPVFEGAENRDLETVIAKIDKTLSKVDTEIIVEVNTILKEIKYYLQSKEFKDIVKNLSSASYELDIALKNTNKIILDIDKSELKLTLKKADDTINLVHNLIKDIEEKKTPIGVLMKDEDTGNELKQIMQNINELTKSLKTNPLISNYNQREKPY